MENALVVLRLFQGFGGEGISEPPDYHTARDNTI
jgi:hypothetical protein